MTEETCQHDVAIAQAADAIRAGTVSAVELMEALLARSRDLDPRLRVWETLDEEAALEAARSAQAEIESSGPMGPLHGVPIAIKDIFNTAGVRIASGSPIYDDFVPDFDSTAVARLRDASAVPYVEQLAGLVEVRCIEHMGGLAGGPSPDKTIPELSELAENCPSTLRRTQESQAQGERFSPARTRSRYSEIVPKPSPFTARGTPV